MGIDFAGVAERVPAGAHGLRAGDRVFGMARSTVPTWSTPRSPHGRDEPLAVIPDGVADDQAAAPPIPAVTALRTVELLEVTAGQHVVVMGATGGVGGYAVQMARSHGAHAIATVRGDADEAGVGFGAEEVYDIEAVDVIDALRSDHPEASMPSLTWSVDPTLSAASTPRSFGPEGAWSRPSSLRTKAGLLSAGSPRTTMPPMRIP